MTDVSLRDWIIAARPKTLTAAFVPVLCGHLIVNYHSHQHVSISLTSLALFCAVLIQVGTNFFNDVVDFKNGVDSDDRSGPKRLLQLGKVSETKMRAAAHACFFCSLLFGVPLVIKGGIGILLIGIVSIVIGYSYSAPPLKLAYRGLAEPFVVFFFGVVAVVGVEWLHTRTMTALGITTGLQLGFLATVLMVINNIRDYKEDAKKGKLTVVARFGRRIGSLEVALFYASTFALSFSTETLMLPLQKQSLIWLIPAMIVMFSVIRGDSKLALNRTLGIAAATHLIFGLGRSLQLLW